MASGLMLDITKRMQEFITKDDIVLDVGCGKCNPTKDLVAKAKIGVDLFRPSLGIASRYCVPINFDIKDLRKIMLPKTVDVALWLDCMEHLEINDALLEINDAVRKINDGVQEINDAVPKINNGVLEINDAVPKINNGVLEINDALREINDGVREINDALPEINDGVQKINVYL